MLRIFPFLQAAVVTSADYAGRACTLPNTTSLPFCDTTLPVRTRAADLVRRMTLDEKTKQLIGGIGGGVTPSVDRLGVPAYQYHSEGLHGLRSTCKLEKEPLHSTMFPQVTAMAATGNLSLIHAMAAHMADEARAVNNLLGGRNFAKGGGLNYWGPTMNIARDPRWGRTQESVSEDPWLNGAYSSTFVRGFQGSGDGVGYTKVAACCKHFFAYSLEGSDGFTRHNFNAKVSARDVAETYYPAFAACVAAAPEQVMCSYNAVNGVPTCLDDAAQNGWLRGTQGWSGLIVSDCDAIGDAWKGHKYSANASQAAAQGIKAGCDLDCGSTYKSANLHAALDAGIMQESNLDLALQRVMTMRFNLGMFDPTSKVPYTNIGAGVLNSAAGQSLALQAARESIILLQNNGSILPIVLKPHQTVAIIGPTADDARVMMGGKSDYCPEHTVTLFDGLTAAGKGAFKVVTDNGSKLKSAVNVAKKADFVIVSVGGVLGQEGRDRTTLTLAEEQEKLINAVSSAVADPSKLALSIVSGEVVALENYLEKFGAIVYALEGGQSAGTAFGEMMTGAINPSGVLPFTLVTAGFVDEVKMSDMSLRPDATTGSRGKTYRFYTGRVVYPFGYGLDYSANWQMRWGNVPSKTISVARLRAGLDIEVQVSNRGAKSGKKVVQLYMRTPEITDAPLRSLIAMDKVDVGAGDSVLVKLNTAAVNGTCAFCVYDKSGKSSIPVDVKYTLSIGNGASDYFDAFEFRSVGSESDLLAVV